MSGWVIAAWLVAYNNLLNLWPPFNGIWYVPLNVAVGAGLLAIALVALNLSASELGLSGNDPYWVLGAVAVALLIAAPLFLAAGFDRTAPWIADERVADLGGFDLLYQVLVRIPLGTAAFEEVAFRGVLYAALASRGPTAAALGSSIAFGLWHIAPTINLLNANRPTAGAWTTAGGVAGAVAFTTAVGLGFTWLRDASGGIAAPIALHGLVNSLATLAAVLAHRTRG